MISLKKKLSSPIYSYQKFVQKLFSGDNRNTNFSGKNRAGKNNVFTKLKEHIKADLIAVGCLEHVVHNTVEFGLDGLPIHLGVILKIYNHFAIYTVRTESLKSFCNFVEVEYKPILSKTRWLSFGPCIERLIKTYAPLK